MTEVRVCKLLFVISAVAAITPWLLLRQERASSTAYSDDALRALEAIYGADDDAITVHVRSHPKAVVHGKVAYSALNCSIG